MRKLAIFLVALSGLSHAETVISSTGPLSGHETLGSNGIDQILYASWTQTTEYDNLDVLAELEGGSISNSVSAYLMTQVGPGTTTAEQVASSTTTIDETDGFVQLFSGLDLGPATYYLVLTASPEAGWGYSFSPTVTTAPGVSNGGNGRAEDNGCSGDCSVDASYPPASLFASPTAPLEFEVETGSATPEPGSLLLAAAGGMALLAVKRRPSR